jgi:hypothetical protein
LVLGTVLSYMAFRRLKYSKVGKENIRGKPMRIWIGHTAFFLVNLRICDLRTGTQRNFTDLRLIIKNLRIFHLRTGTPHKFADLRLGNEPKNLRTNKNISCPPLLGDEEKRMGVVG